MHRLFAAFTAANVINLKKFKQLFIAMKLVKIRTRILNKFQESISMIFNNLQTIVYTNR